MKVLMLSWELPPDHVGGLGKHVFHLSRALSAQGAETHVVTIARTNETTGGNDEPWVHRLMAYPVSSPDFVSWVLQLNVAMLERAIAVSLEHGEMSLVHAHDWLSCFAARAYKHAFCVPMVATIHATEAGRNAGIHNAQQKYISDVEWWLGYEAWRIICCSSHMKNEVTSLFGAPEDKIEVIPNGVDPEEFRVPDRALSRDLFAHRDESMVFFVGRLVREKGVDTLIEAVRILLDQGRKIKLVIAGTGPYEENLKFKAAMTGIYSNTYFTGRITDNVRNHLYMWADAAVFPSYYEPFGIVALEAMAAGSGLVVSDTGGMSEVVSHELNGLKVKPGDPAHLASAIARLIDERELRHKIRRAGLETVRRRYAWPQIAKHTLRLYDSVLAEYHRSAWGKNPHARTGGIERAGSDHGGRRRFEAQTSHVHDSEADGAGVEHTGDATHSGPA